MAITTEILRSYRAPGATFGRQLAGGAREDRALIYLFLACLLIFISTLPGLSRAAFLDDTVPFEARFGGALLAWLFIVPLVLYAVAAASHMVARLLGGSGSFFGARLALFWALLVVAPLWLLHGMVAGFIGHGPALNIVAWLLVAAFFYIWLACLRRAEQGDAA